MIRGAEGPAVNAAISAMIGVRDAPHCALMTPCCCNDDSKFEHTSLTGKLRASAQISRRPASIDNRGTTFRRLGKKPVMDSAVQVELQRQAKVILKGAKTNPNKYRKQEERHEAGGASFASQSNHPFCGDSHDQKAHIGRVPALLEEEGQIRKAKKPRHLQVTRCREEAREGSSVLQAGGLITHIRALESPGEI